jgi:hypothetical protein
MSKAVLPHTIAHFIQVVNRGDRNNFLAFFPSDGVVIDSGWRFAGHDAIRNWSDHEFIGAHGRMTCELRRADEEYNHRESRLEMQLLHRSGTV